MAPQFVFLFKDIDNGMLDVHEPLPHAWLADALGDTEVEATPDRSGRLDVSLTASGRDVVVRGQVQASIDLPCGRCLKPTSIAVKGDLALLLVPGKADESEETETHKSKKNKGHDRSKGNDGTHRFAADEAELDTYVGDEIVLDGFIREAILLELPIFPLCSETCPGIGAPASENAESTSAEESIDPRLAPLMELKKRV